MNDVIKKEFGELVRRAQAGDTVAQRELRTYADDPRMRREAAERAYRANPQDVVRKRAEGKSSHRSDPQLRIDRAVLWNLRELLGITKAVTIRWVAAEDIPGLNGSHEYTAKGEHLIKLRVGRSAANTNRTALHELAHAASATAYANRWQWARARDREPQRYEDEADEVAGLLAHLPLVS